MLNGSIKTGDLLQYTVLSESGQDWSDWWFISLENIDDIDTWTKVRVFSSRAGIMKCFASNFRVIKRSKGKASEVSKG